MMKGNNKMLLNKATVTLALQEWINRHTVGTKPEIWAISWDGNHDMLEVFVREPDSK